MNLFKQLSVRFRDWRSIQKGNTQDNLRRLLGDGDGNKVFSADKVYEVYGYVNANGIHKFLLVGNDNQLRFVELEFLLAVTEPPAMQLPAEPAEETASVNEQEQPVSSIPQLGKRGPGRPKKTEEDATTTVGEEPDPTL